MEDDRKIEFAVKALIFRDGRFLAVHKTGIHSLLFELPGGRMIFGETAEDTVIREVFEETGLKVRICHLIDTWNYIAETFQVTGIIYLCTASDTNTVVLSGEHDRYEWLATDAESLEQMNRLFKTQMLNWDWDALMKLSK